MCQHFIQRQSLTEKEDMYCAECKCYFVGDPLMFTFGKFVLELTGAFHVAFCHNWSAGSGYFLTQCHIIVLLNKIYAIFHQINYFDKVCYFHNLCWFTSFLSFFNLISFTNVGRLLKNSRPGDYIWEELLGPKLLLLEAYRVYASSKGSHRLKIGEFYEIIS